MIYSRNELLFPHRYVAALKGQRGAEWQALVTRVCVLTEDDPESLGFCLLLVDLCGCLKCDLNSYKASLGCRACARRAVSSFKGSDEELLASFEEAVAQVKAALAGEIDRLSVE